MAAVQSITQNRFKVHLHDDGNNMVAVSMALKQLAGIGLNYAKELVESAPCVVRDYGNIDDALRLSTAINKAGGSAYIEDSAAGTASRDDATCDITQDEGWLWLYECQSLLTMLEQALDTVTIHDVDTEEYKAQVGAIQRRLVEAMDSIEKYGGSVGVELRLAAVMFDAWADCCSTMTGDECAKELRRYLVDVSENRAAAETEDRYTATKTVTLKGLRYLVAREQFMESLLSDEGAENMLSEGGAS